MPNTGSRNSDILERLDRIETLITAIHSILMHERAWQAEEIDRYITRWKESQFEGRELQLPD